MKKFLFTLAAMFMVTSAFAANVMYISPDDFTVTKADIENGTEIEIPVRAEFSGRVSGWDFEITELPAGMTFTFAEAGADMSVSVKNGRGRDAVVNATLYGAAEPYLHMLATLGEFGYWQDPNGENPTAWVTYGVAKWEAGEYEEMLLMYAVFDENYHGGPIKTKTAVSSGKDTRGGTVNDIGEANTFYDTEYEFEDPNPVTEEPADAPVIEFAEDAAGLMITIENYTECSIKVDGVEVSTEAPYYVEKIYDAAQAIEVYAKNAPAGFTPAEDTKTYNLPEKQKEQTSKPSVTYSYENGELTVWAYGSEDDAVYTLYCDGVVYNGEMPIAFDIYEGYNHVWTATALAPNCLESEMSDECPIVIEAVVPEYQTPEPVITVDDDTENEVVTITVTGEGTVTMKVSKMNDDPSMTSEVVYEASGESPLTYEIPYGDVEAYYSVYATATADKPGYDVYPADAVEPFVVVPAKTVEQTEKPVITTEETEEGVVVTATGNGHICLYWDDQLMAEGEGVATWTIAYGEDPEGEEYGVAATAQEQGKLVSDYALETVFVPGKEVGPEIDPEHQQGWWIVLLDKSGNEIWYRIWQGSDGSYTTTVTLDYATYGEFFWNPNLSDAENDANRPAVPFYFVVDGKVWGSENDYQATAMGESANTVSNPLFEGNEGYYTVPVGFSYTLGIFVDKTGLRPDTDKYVYCAQALPTSVDEVNGEKAVAGVRYYNLAGQEMQEANGMTIVVTTYTDGTTSAVKVMK